jgi:hypothetical protein
MMGKTDSKLAESKKMQLGDECQRVDVERLPLFGLCSVICWWRDWCLMVHWNRQHKLISFTRGNLVFELSLPYSVKSPLPLLQGL